MIKLPEGLVTRAARNEDQGAGYINKGVAAGEIVVPCNSGRCLDKPCAIGRGLSTKVNANIGLSQYNSDIDSELRKLDAAVESGADAVMDLSTGFDIQKLRAKILSNAPVPLGTVPVYELACGKEQRFSTIREEDFLEIIEKQASEGVDFFTVHAGITYDLANYASRNPRLINIVSRGGALLASWMLKNKKENPFYSNFDRVIEICAEYNVTLSLGDSLRPGAIADATDFLQVQELLLLGKLQERALSGGVQVMIEGPGHVPLDQIEANVKLQKKVCHGAPFYVLGPLVTDAAPGYDHIVSAIGGAVAAWHGADFLCYVTPAEHLRLPDIDDVRNGVIASKIAAHAADIVKKLPSAENRDRLISEARARRDWKTQFALSLDPRLPEQMRSRSAPREEDVCTMCSDYCSIKITEEAVRDHKDGRDIA